jgi:putative oxidoreductase
MDLIKSSEIWRIEHQQSKILAGLRVILGLVILYKGIYFVSHWRDLSSVLSQSQAHFGFGSSTLAHLIALCHLCGGLFIAIGFLTRPSILFQIPLVLGAILFVNAPRSVYSVYSEWFLSVVILLGLLFFLYYGSGLYSAEVFLKRKRFYE